MMYRCTRQAATEVAPKKSRFVFYSFTCLDYRVIDAQNGFEYLFLDDST